MRNLVCGASVFALLAASAEAQSLSDRLNETRAEAVAVEMAVGRLGKANAVVADLIATPAAERGVTITKIESRGSTESTQGVCANAVPAAVVQKDAVNAFVRDRRNQCDGKLVVSKPVYPYYGYLATPATNGASSFYELVDDLDDATTAGIAAGTTGSGGQITFGNLLNQDEDRLKAKVAMRSADETTALDQVLSGQFAAYFVMDAPNTELVGKLRNRVDDDEEPAFKFIDVDPWDAFFDDFEGWDGQPLYYPATIEIPGFFSSNVTTVAVDAVMIVNQQWAERNPAAYETLVVSLDLAQADIRRDLEVPSDWSSKR